MPEQALTVSQPVKSLELDRRVLRAVPCPRHAPNYIAACPNCLTGEQAFAAGVPQVIEERETIRWHRNPLVRTWWRLRGLI